MRHGNSLWLHFRKLYTYWVDIYAQKSVHLVPEEEECMHEKYTADHIVAIYNHKAGGGSTGVKYRKSLRAKSPVV